MCRLNIVIFALTRSMEEINVDVPQENPLSLGNYRTLLVKQIASLVPEVTRLVEWMDKYNECIIGKLIKVLLQLPIPALTTLSVYQELKIGYVDMKYC
ncbi:hypothetical protein Tco_0291915 [Tanacetum coccineum]